MKNKSLYIDLLITVLLVLTGGSLVLVFFRNPLTIVLFLVLLFLLILKIKQFKIIDFQFAIFSFLLVLTLLFINYVFAIGHQTIIKYGYIALCFVTAVFAIIYFRSLSSINKFLSAFRIVLIIILFHSIANFLAYPFLKDVLSTIEYVFSGYDCATYKNIFFYEPAKNEINLFGIALCRNQGFFWEPGILQIYLNVFLFLELFLNRQINKSLIILIVLAILMAYSTTGIMLLIIQLGVYFSKQIRKNIIILPLIGLFMLPIYFVMKSNINDKVHGDRSSSFSVRMFDLVQPLMIVKEHPFTGVGLDKETYRVTRSKYSYSSDFFDFDSLEKGSSNSILFMMSAAGIPFALLMMIGLYSQDVIVIRNRLFFIIMIVSLMSEPLILTPFFLFFIMSGLKNITQKISWGRMY